MNDDQVPCQFKNLDLTKNSVDMIFKNVKTKLINQKLSKKYSIEKSYIEGICSLDRKLAYFIRLNLRDILTSDHRSVWFHIQTKSLDEIEDRSQLLRKIEDNIQVTFSFGSMLSCDIFIGHTNDRRLAKIFIGKAMHRTIRLDTSAYSITLNYRNIDPQILVNHLTNDNSVQVIFMLKATPIIHWRDSRTDRENKEFVGNLSNCSDLLIRFYPASTAWSFLRDMPIAGYGRNAAEDIFHINFAMFQWKNSDYLSPVGKPTFDALSDTYGIDMLWSLGHIFQDKYKADSSKIINADPQNLYKFSCAIWRTLKSNHCSRICDVNMIEHRSLNSSDKVEVAYAIITPTRVEYQPKLMRISHRGFDHYPSDNWLLVHFRDINTFDKIHKLSVEIRAHWRYMMLSGIKRANRTYKYFGCSCSQMNEQAGWFLALPQNETIDQAREKLGKFSEIKNVSTYIARVGLLLTTSKSTGITLKYIGDRTNTATNPAQNPNRTSLFRRIFRKLFYKSKNKKIEYTVEIIEDVEERGYCFTDGCGLISRDLARLVAQNIGLQIDCTSDIPSAFQIRIAGCKGMVAIDPNPKSNKFYLKIRKSMWKFESDDWTLHIVDHSRPMPLSLNNQVIRLLSDLGVSNGVFESIQTRCIDRKEFWHPPPKSYLNAMESLDQGIIEEKRKKYRNIKHFLQKNKIPLPVNEARCLFGIPDESGKLNEGECFIQYRALNSSYNPKTYFIVEGPVIVTKMPCLYPGDVRKLQAVQIPKLERTHRDCIVFSTKGSRPIFNQMAGSDLDGDLYWVYWGNEIHISHVIDPLSYEPASKLTSPNITNERVIDHILDTLIYNIPGIICNTHKVIADKHPQGTRSEECRKLAELFARAIDARKTGEIIPLDYVNRLRDQYCQTYPGWMMKFNESIMDPPSTSINEILHQRAVEAYIHPDNYEDILRPHADAQLPIDETTLLIEQQEEQEPKDEFNCRAFLFVIFILLVLGVAVSYGIIRFYKKYIHKFP